MNKLCSKFGYLIIATILIGFAGGSEAFSNENRLSFGFGYGSFFENRTDDGVAIETSRGAPGFNFSGYHLWDNFGFFHSHSFLLPSTVSSDVDGYDYFFQYNLIVGPAFKIAFTEKLDMNLGFGISLSPVSGEFNNNALSQFNFGIGGDIGVSFFVNEMIYLNIGSSVSYHFFNTTSIDTGKYVEEADGDREEIEDTMRSRNYNMAGIEPYIKIGIMLK